MFYIQTGFQALKGAGSKEKNITHTVPYLAYLD